MDFLRNDYWTNLTNSNNKFTVKIWITLLTLNNIKNPSQISHTTQPQHAKPKITQEFDSLLENLETLPDDPKSSNWELYQKNNDKSYFLKFLKENSYAIVPRVNESNIEHAFDRIKLGVKNTASKSPEIDQKKRRAALINSAKALFLLKESDLASLDKISIGDFNQQTGALSSYQSKDKTGYSKVEVLKQISFLQCGPAVEEIFYGEGKGKGKGKDWSRSDIVRVLDCQTLVNWRFWEWLVYIYIDTYI